jgi:hypothetical protein
MRLIIHYDYHQQRHLCLTVLILDRLIAPTLFCRTSRDQTANRAANERCAASRGHRCNTRTAKAENNQPLRERTLQRLTS